MSLEQFCHFCSANSWQPLQPSYQVQSSWKYSHRVMATISIHFRAHMPLKRCSIYLSLFQYSSPSSDTQRELFKGTSSFLYNKLSLEHSEPICYFESILLMAVHIWWVQLQFGPGSWAKCLFHREWSMPRIIRGILTLYLSVLYPSKNIESCIYSCICIFCIDIIWFVLAL
jgi:hypothetical protein